MSKELHVGYKKNGIVSTTARPTIIGIGRLYLLHKIMTKIEVAKVDIPAVIAGGWGVVWSQVKGV
jgi:hypothetical protein